MNTIPRTSLLWLGLALLAATAVRAAEPAAPAAGSPVVVPSTTETSDRLKAGTFEERAGFSVLVKELGAQAEAARGELNAGYNEMQASPARRAAMELLRLRAADFKDKTSALDNVSAETWETVKSSLVTPWQNLQGAIAKARAAKA